MAKNFDEVFAEIKEYVTEGPRRSFSKSDFIKLTKAFINETEYSVTIGQDDESVFPVKEFRKMLERILLDFGVDKQEASRILKDYRIENVNGVYEFCSELIYQYANTGRSFDFMPKPDFIGSLRLEEVEAEEDFKEYRNPKDKTGQSVSKIKKGKHKILKVKSKCPSWLKERQ